jgi:hypothetical protein
MGNYVMDDILVGIFASFPDGKRQFLHDRVRAHRFFYDRKTKYPVLSNVIFRVREFPESEEVDQAYSNLKATGMLGSWGMRFNPHEFSPRCKGYFDERVSKLFDEEQLRSLMELSREFQEEFCLKAKASQSAN